MGESVRMAQRAHIYLSGETLQALDLAAEQDRRTRSATVQIAVEQFLAQRSVSGASRLTELERLAAEGIAKRSPRPDTAAADHLAEHRRLCGLIPNTQED